MVGRRVINGGISDLAVTHIFIFKKLSARDFEIFLNFPRVCTLKGVKYLLFLAIAPQGKFIGILYLDSHITLIEYRPKPSSGYCV